MTHKMIFQLSYRMKRPQVLRYYNEFQKTQWLPFEELQERQTKQLRKLIAFAYKNVPYYTRVFNELGLKPPDIANIQDLEKLPILTKQTIKRNWQDFLFSPKPRRVLNT
jgi:phenylacetate-CoA ligase